VATVIRAAIVIAAVAGCGDLSGLGGTVPPLATIQVQATGDFASVQIPGSAPVLRVALVWGAQWLPEPLCVAPPDNAGVAALVAAGCRDPFGFVPVRVAANAPLAADGSASIELPDLPAADVMIGDVTARVAYGTLVVYDDRDGDGTLTLGLARRLGGRDDNGPDEDPGRSTLDRVYAASFATMTEPDRRLAFREGQFNAAAAFYPRSGCGDPPPGFSIVAAGGFTAASAIAAQNNHQLPPEDPATCSEVAVDTPVPVAFRPPAALRELACEERVFDSSVRYREPPVDVPALADRAIACAPIPDFGTGQASGMRQAAVSGTSDDSCAGITHYVLRGCREDARCELPDWDITATPPSWWPCPAQAAQ
jgi:hypothetical protein